jgi:hypothetical protein
MIGRLRFVTPSISSPTSSDTTQRARTHTHTHTHTHTQSEVHGNVCVSINQPNARHESVLTVTTHATSSNVAKHDRHTSTRNNEYTFRGGAHVGNAIHRAMLVTRAKPNPTNYRQLNNDWCNHSGTHKCCEIHQQVTQHQSLLTCTTHNRETDNAQPDTERWTQHTTRERGGTTNQGQQQQEEEGD